MESKVAKSLGIKTKVNRPYKRRTVLIKPHFQIKYAITMLFLFGLAALLVWWEAYRDLAGAAGFFSVYDSSMRPILDQLTKVLLVKVSLMLGGVWIFSIFAFHLVAGPIYRIENSLKAMQSGDLTLRIRFRKKDEFQDVGSVFNDTLESLQERIQKDIEKVVEISDRLQSFSENLEGETADKLLAIANDMRTVTKSFII